jgi:hypothetical protein
MPAVVDSAARPPRIGILSKPLFANVSREVPAEQQETAIPQYPEAQSRGTPETKIGTTEAVHIDASLIRADIGTTSPSNMWLCAGNLVRVDDVSESPGNESLRFQSAA